MQLDEFYFREKKEKVRRNFYFWQRGILARNL